MNVDQDPSPLSTTEHSSAREECHHIGALSVSEFLDLSSSSRLREVLESSDPTTTSNHRENQQDPNRFAVLGLVLIHGCGTHVQAVNPYPSSNTNYSVSSLDALVSSSSSGAVLARLFHSWLQPATDGLHPCHCITATVRVCEHSHPHAYRQFLGDDSDDKDDSSTLPPPELPALAVVAQWCPQPSSSSSSSQPSTHTKRKTGIRYLYKLSSTKLMQLLVYHVQQHALQQAERQSFVSWTTTTRIPSQPPRRWMHETLTAIAREIPTAVFELEQELNFPMDLGGSSSSSSSSSSSCLRLFVAGDKSSVGKTSTCLGLLGTLVHHLGYAPQEVAYIKPATQSEALNQPIQVYCKAMGIAACVPIGPLVYYRGFTRAYLAHETASASELLQQCAHAVDRVARNKRVVIVDGVGFPAVGSICGTDNATMAQACGYPILDSASVSLQRRSPMAVLLVGGSGVGAAVDSYNLNATYFQHKQVPVLGAIFNKLAPSGFYSLSNCREQVSLYFQQQQEQEQEKATPNETRHVPHAPLTSLSTRVPPPRPFGFVPTFPAIGQGGPDGRTIRLAVIQEFIDLFHSHVDVPGILQAAMAHQPASTNDDKQGKARQHNIPKRPWSQTRDPLIMATVRLPQKRTRAEIEQDAIEFGAAPSA